MSLGEHTTNTSITFVDSRVAHYQDLIDSLPPGSEVFVLNSALDGIAQMLSYLQGRTGLDAIHLISHGSVGALYLGSTILNSDNLGQYQAQISGIGRALHTTGDILLYGCDVGQGDAGVQFVAALATATGADVAASEDATGAAGLGGDWVREASVGQVDAQALNVAVDVGVLGVNTAPRFVLPDLADSPIGIVQSGTARSVAIQSDGKILLGGGSITGDFSLIRFNADGSIDTSFDGDGKSVISVGTSSDAGYSVAVQSDGKIVMGGTSNVTGRPVLVLGTTALASLCSQMARYWR